MSRINALYGYGGFGREVMPILKNLYPNDKNIFVVHKEFMPEQSSINSTEIISFEDFLDIPNHEKNISITIADPIKRSTLSKEIDSHKITRKSIFSKNSLIMDNVEISNGAIICPFVTLTSNIRIGQNFHANLYSYVAHDCIVGNNVTFAPSVKCNGNVIIEDNVFIGTGAIIKQGKKDNPIVIGANSIISSGSFVTKNVSESTTVFGNPAKALSKSSLK
tara:strand:- start:1298 stop:1957 length:660 start_codon:yes stop_codon:yes gene_type:complete